MNTKPTVAEKFTYLFGIPGPSGFSSCTTAREVATKFLPEGTTNRTAIVTGGNSGIGLVTVKTLAEKGINVILCSRDVKSGEDAANSIKADIGSKANVGTITVMALDLASGASIRKFVEEFKALNVPCHYLINNAGVMACPLSKTKDGFEMQFGTNHLGHFLLTTLLLDVLKASAPSRVVCLSSSAVALAPPRGIIFDDLLGEKHYEAWQRYGQSKLANVLFASELQRRLDEQGPSGVVCSSLHPGAILTNLTRHLVSESVAFWIRPVMKALLALKSPEQGAATTVYCTLSPDIIPGAFYDDCNLATPQHPLHGDIELAKKLWEVSEQLWADVSLS